MPRVWPCKANLLLWLVPEYATHTISRRPVEIPISNRESVHHCSLDAVACYLLFMLTRAYVDAVIVSKTTLCIEVQLREWPRGKSVCSTALDECAVQSLLYTDETVFLNMNPIDTNMHLCCFASARIYLRSYYSNTEYFDLRARSVFILPAQQWPCY